MPEENGEFYFTEEDLIAEREALKEHKEALDKQAEKLLEEQRIHLSEMAEKYPDLWDRPIFGIEEN